MTTSQMVITVALAVFATVLTRALPFLVFSEKRPLPKYMEYLGKILPGAVFGMLVIYCFKGVDINVFPHGLPELIAAFAVIAIHLYKRNMLLSVLSGTAIYMILIRTFFA